jgi:hypothetical protein
MVNEGNQLQNFKSSSGADFLPIYGSGSGSGSTTLFVMPDIASLLKFLLRCCAFLVFCFLVFKFYLGQRAQICDERDVYGHLEQQGKRPQYERGTSALYPLKIGQRFFLYIMRAPMKVDLIVISVTLAYSCDSSGAVSSGLRKIFPEDDFVF